jgi:hypothetical protein
VAGAEALCHRALLYDKVKGPAPHDAKIVHLLGLIAHRAGNAPEAIACKRNVALRARGMKE